MYNLNTLAIQHLDTKGETFLFCASARLATERHLTWLRVFSVYSHSLASLTQRSFGERLSTVCTMFIQLPTTTLASTNLSPKLIGARGQSQRCPWLTVEPRRKSFVEGGEMNHLGFLAGSGRPTQACLDQCLCPPHREREREREREEEEREREREREREKEKERETEREGGDRERERTSFLFQL